jgi:hypothetical protein
MGRRLWKGKDLTLEIHFTEMGSQEYLLSYACPPSFLSTARRADLSAVFMADCRAYPPVVWRSGGML